IVCPGHGPLAGKDVLESQKRYFVELRKQVQAGIDGGKKLDEITAAIDMPWYKEWTGKDAKLIKDNVEHVYKELTGKIEHDKLGRRTDSPLSWPYGPRPDVRERGHVAATPSVPAYRPVPL